MESLRTSKSQHFSKARLYVTLYFFRLYTVCRCNDHEIAYKVHPKASSCHYEDITSFFRLDSGISLLSLVEKWCEHDPVFKKKSSNCVGVRLLSVNPFEALISFICSSNNHINRITNMIALLCSTLGQHVGTKNHRKYYKFPTVDALCREDCESLLRSHGFGYRAKYIHKCSQQILEYGGEQWLHSLKKLNYEGIVMLYPFYYLM